LIEAAFEEIHRQGFQGASIDRILQRIGVTRGALFHHFPSKIALGYAVVDEHLGPAIERSWIEPLAAAGEPVAGLVALVESKVRALGDAEIQLGCPLNNLAQEMSPLDQGFQQRTRALFDRWRDAIRDVVRRGQEAGTIDPGADASALALAVLALYEGAISLAKNAQSRAPLRAASAAIEKLLEAHRPPAKRRQR
jgi:AcrR family transcriptional regulator